jgi:hypothetical protein
LNVRIDIGNEKVCILLYADDVVFLCENEDDLQEMLNTLESWCYTIVIKLITENSLVSQIDAPLSITDHTVESKNLVYTSY